MSNKYLEFKVDLLRVIWFYCAMFYSIAILITIHQNGWPDWDVHDSNHGPWHRTWYRYNFFISAIHVIVGFIVSLAYLYFRKGKSIGILCVVISAIQMAFIFRTIRCID